MQDIELAKRYAQETYRELMESLDGLSEGEAWAKIQCRPGEYLHSEGSILSIVAHVAGCKFLYGSMAYRGLEVRWRDVVARLESFWPSWSAMLEYLNESHRYWMSSWETETDLERMVKRFDNKDWPSWKIIWMVTHHDAYHAGQIQVLRSVLEPSSTPPPPEGDEWRKYCQPLPSW